VGNKVSTNFREWGVGDWLQFAGNVLLASSAGFMQGGVETALLMGVASAVALLQHPPGS
jgi:hypothetical protein